MSVARWWPRVVVAAVLFGSLSCGEPPQKEMEQAQVAIDAARAAGAEQYAASELAEAVKALAQAHQTADQRDYRLALTYALDSRERAQSAARSATDAKVATRLNADRAIAAAASALTTAQTRLKASGSRLPARTLTARRRTIADAERQLQEARAALAKDDFRAASAAAEGASARLAAISRDTAPSGSSPARRGR